MSGKKKSKRPGAPAIRQGLPKLSPDAQEQDGQIDNVVPMRGYCTVPVVGLGGSAGSIAALQTFFAAMAPQTGMAFVVVMHLSPEHESTLPDLLARWTQMRVNAAVDGVKVEPNHVYVIPPGKHLSSIDGHLRLTDLERERGRRVAVDLFFRSLADTHGPHATAIVLSGADGDGAIGIKRIKERGGLTIAQEPNEAEHFSMPQSAIATGMVDWVLPVAEIPARLVDYHAREPRLNLPPEEGPQPVSAPPLSAGDGETALREVLAFLRARTGRDFSYYKRATILRRISRRMQINAVEDLPAYLSFLRTHPGESEALLQDLLISVTNFFRDRESFSVIEGMIPELFRGKGADDTVRVWVPASATGEETYSMAMLLLEHAATLDGDAPAVQVFGCDLDEHAIQTARTGAYSETIVADVSENRLRRFFQKEGQGYRVRREVREVVLFAAHDLVKDAPFSRMDLVSCRNLMIYLTRDAQARVLDLFHFALRPHGLLFLGSSESVEERSELFEVVDKRHRIYRHSPAQRTGLPVPASPSTLMRSLQAREQAERGPVLPGQSFTRTAAMPAPDLPRISENLSPEDLHFRLIERLAPPSILVNADHEIIHLSESAGRFLQLAGGQPTTSLLRVVHPMLRSALRGALFQASETNSVIELPRLPFEIDGSGHPVNIRVSPARELAPGFLLLTFELSDMAAVSEAPGPRPTPEPVARHLEREIEVTRRRLRDTVEQYEASTEELKASNEELQAMNEELRSASEELETSREELQSLNEELSTVNTELKASLDELSQANADLQNLMASTAIATVFIDRELRIMRYTPSAVGLFRIISSDVGRPLADLRHQLEYPELIADALRVLAQLTPIEREVSAGDRWFLARLLPYRTLDERIAGVVLAFVDVTAAKRADQALRANEEQLRRAIEEAPIPVIVQAEDGQVLQISNTWTELTGYSREDIPTFEAWLNRAYGSGSDKVREHVHNLFRGGARQLDVEIDVNTRAGDIRRWAFSASAPGRLRDGRRFLIGMALDITERKSAEEALKQSRAEAEAANRTKDRFLAILSHELRTPLTPVLMAAESLLKKKDLPPRAVEGLQMICQNVELELTLTNELLDLSRISHGKFELKSKPVELHRVIERAVAIARPDIEAKQQRLSLQLSADSDAVVADSERLQQVFWNVLKNAAKFTPEDGEIRVASMNEGKSIVVEISDTGHGIPAAALPRIFEPFQQADESITREFGGLGLGLAIAKSIVEAHAGTIVAQSQGLGTGSTMIITLPLDKTQKLPQDNS